MPTRRTSFPFPLAPLGTAIALLLAPSAWAQQGNSADTALPTVTVKTAPTSDTVVTQNQSATVGKSPATVHETPFAMSVIRVEQMREAGAKTVEDTLLYSAGVYAGRYGFDTRGDWAAVRGLSPSMYQDGLRSLFGYYNNVRPEIYTLESVEVLKGPSSALYGQAELGGIVNVVSKQPQKAPSREIELQLGSHNRRQLAADFTGPLNADQTLLYRLVALGRKSGTQVDYVNDDALVLMPSLQWQPHADTREIYTSVGPIPTAPGNISRTVHAADRKTDVLGTDLRLEGTLQAGPIQHQVGVGVDYQNALWEEFNYFSQSGVGSFNVYNPVYGSVGALNLSRLPLADRPDNKIVQTGIYATDHITWGPWIVSGAVRHDQARNQVLNLATPNTVVKNTATTGRLGLMYQFAAGLAPYASLSNSFVPNLGTDGTAAASYLKPTTGTQKEIGLKYLAPTGKTSAALAWFDIEQKNRVVDGSTPGGREQIGAAIQGWELEARHRTGAWDLLANYTRMDAVNPATGKRLSAIAEATASAWVEYHFAGGWRVGLGGRYIGDLTGNGGAPVVPSVALYDAMVGYVTGNWDFRLNIKNLADKQYVSWCRGPNMDCGYGERLNASLTARYRF